MSNPQSGAAGRRMISTAAVVACTILLASPVRGQREDRPDLTGTWLLNRELSERTGTGSAPEDGRNGGGRHAPGGGMGRPGGMGGRGGGYGGRGGSGGEMPDEEQMERMRAAMDAAMRVPARLIIVKAETGLVLTDDEGVSVRIPPEGKKDTGATYGVPFETTTKWENGKLQVERKFKGGLKAVDEYSVAGDPRLLTVTSKIEGSRAPGGGRVVNRVYDQEPRLAPLEVRSRLDASAFIVPDDTR